MIGRKDTRRLVDGLDRGWCWCCVGHSRAWIGSSTFNLTRGWSERAKPMRDVPWRSRAGSLLTINPLPCKMTVTDAPYEAHLSKEDHKVKYPHIASEADMKAHRLKLPTRDLCSGCVPEVLPPPLSALLPRFSSSGCKAYADAGDAGMDAWVLGVIRYLIPLNQCRYETFMLPWKCEPEL
jgi:hypothetical protein